MKLIIEGAPKEIIEFTESVSKQFGKHSISDLTECIQRMTSNMEKSNSVIPLQEYEPAQKGEKGK